jgi:hypothetical protein
MAQFWGLQRLTAATIEAPEADAGDVLTADGAGGAAFAAPTGGGGMPTIPVTRDWATADNAWLDIADALGFVLPPSYGEQSGLTLRFMLQHGTAWGVLNVYEDFGSPIATWKSQSWYRSTPPTTGTATLYAVMDRDV